MTVRTALVCGGTSGLGGGIALALRQQGVHVVSTSSRAPSKDSVVKDIVHLDFHDKASPAACAQALASSNIKPDILIVNGPGPAKGTTLSVSAEAWQESFDLLWAGPLALLGQLLPPMVERRWGRVIWVTSVSCVRFVPNLSVSTSLRAGLHGLLTTLSAEHASQGVTFNAVAPGYHATDRMKQLGVQQTVLDEIPVGRLGTPEEFGTTAAFLAREEAGYLTGQVLVCDGGWSHGKLSAKPVIQK
jgi:3-oxoacyl-[acyl-carrier protein] reductase